MKKNLIFYFTLILFFIIANGVCVGSNLGRAPCANPGEEPGAKRGSGGGGSRSSLCRHDKIASYNICVNKGQSNAQCLARSVCLVNQGDKAPDSECSNDADCRPKPIKCPEGETNPHYICDTKTNKCMVKYVCGKSTCRLGECCDGATDPHYICDDSSAKKGECKRIAGCGFSTCDPKYDECQWWQRNYYGQEECIKWENPKCTTTTTTTTSKPLDPGNRYVCDPNSIKVDGYGQCILDNANKHPGAKACDNKNNKAKIIPTKCKFEWQKNQTCVEYVTYNTGCADVKETPSITSKAPPKVQNACRISNFGFYYKKNNLWKDVLPLFSKPDEGILDEHKLGYFASECETCELTIEPSIPNFISKNPNIFGKLKGELMKGFSNRYIFDRSDFNNELIILDVNELTPGSYTLTLDCTDPVLKEHQIKSVKLNIFPQLRWREVVPIIN